MTPKSGFFVYAFHGFPILILSKVIVMVFQPSNSIMWLICYLLDFFVITSLSIYYEGYFQILPL